MKTRQTKSSRCLHPICSGFWAVLTLLQIAALIYMLAAWAAFQWRNPKSNEMSFYRHFWSVMTWQKLPEYE